MASVDGYLRAIPIRLTSCPVFTPSVLVALSCAWALNATLGGPVQPGASATHLRLERGCASKSSDGRDK